MSLDKERDLEHRYPFIPWREPLPITVFSDQEVQGLACRLCTAIQGLKGSEIGSLPRTREEFEKHMNEHHNKTEGSQ